MEEKYLDGESAVSHIMKCLDKLPHTMRKDSVAITCPYHSPTYPSYSYHRLSINLVPHYRGEEYIPVGIFHCWSCGKVGFFNKLITDETLPKERRLKAEPIPRAGSYLDDKLFDFSIEKSTKKEFVPISPLLLGDWKYSWRGIGEKVLKKMGAYSYFDYNPYARNKRGELLDIGGTERLLFYAYDENKEKIGWIALAREKERQDKFCLKQKNSEGEWASKTVLFHEKYADNTPIVLVEGPFDSLRLIQEGIQSCCMLGAGNWSEEKRDLLANKASHVIVFFDGDETGWKDSKMVYESIKDYVPTLRLRLPIIGDREKNLDPGNAPIKYINQLKIKIKNFVKNNS